jgi:hypothetical protein
MSDAQQDTEATGIDTAGSGDSSKLSLNRETLTACTEGGGTPEPGGGSDPKGGRDEER